LQTAGAPARVSVRRNPSYLVAMTNSARCQFGGNREPFSLGCREKQRSRLRDLNSGPAVYESGSGVKGFGRLLGGVFPRGNVAGTPGAWALALAAESALKRAA
jgi:hypothetical protein